MNKRWSDFLFTVAVRIVCGLIIGFSAGLLLGWRIILRQAGRDDTRWIVLWLLAWTVGGALVAAFSTPRWQTPWYKGIRDPDGRASVDHKFRRVAPELYNRLVHPSPKQFHDFVGRLREVTVADLEVTRGDIAATKAAFVRFFQRGLRAELLLGELMDILPSIIRQAGYSETEGSELMAMARALGLEELGVKPNEKGARFDAQAANQDGIDGSTGAT